MSTERTMSNIQRNCSKLLKKTLKEGTTWLYPQNFKATEFYILQRSAAVQAYTSRTVSDGQRSCLRDRTGIAGR